MLASLPGGKRDVPSAFLTQFLFFKVNTMTHRLSTITTRTGDDGSTGLGDGSRVAKDCPRVRLLGEVDELNSHLGVLLCETLPDAARAALVDTQHDLFDLGGEIAVPGYQVIGEIQVLRLESWLATLNADLPPLREFILPGGCRAAALAHVGRAVARRAERQAITLAREDIVSPHVLHYLNRLSDVLFVLARHLNVAAGAADVLWRHPGGR